MQRKRFISGFQIKLRIYIYSRHIFSVLEFAQYFVKCSLIVSATSTVLLTILLSALISKILDVLPLLRKLPLLASRLSETQSFFASLIALSAGAPNESVPHIICSPEESCWLAKIQVFRLAGWEILLLIEVLPGNY